MFSLLGCEGELPEQLWLPYVNPRTGEVDEKRWNVDETVLVEELCAASPDPDEQATAARVTEALLQDVGRRVVFRLIAYGRERFAGDDKRACAWWLAKHRATDARFTSVPSAVLSRVAA